jgi:hypothetical protein
LIKIANGSRNPCDVSAAAAAESKDTGKRCYSISHFFRCE